MYVYKKRAESLGLFHLKYFFLEKSLPFFLSAKRRDCITRRHCRPGMPWFLVCTFFLLQIQIHSGETSVCSRFTVSDCEYHNNMKARQQ